MLTLTVYVEEVEAKHRWRRKISEPGTGVLLSVCVCTYLAGWCACVCLVAKRRLTLCDPMSFSECSEGADAHRLEHHQTPGQGSRQ